MFIIHISQTHQLICSVVINNDWKNGCNQQPVLLTVAQRPGTTFLSLRLVSPSRLDVSMWHIPLRSDVYKSSRSAGTISLQSTFTKSPTRTSFQRRSANCLSFLKDVSLFFFHRRHEGFLHATRRSWIKRPFCPQAARLPVKNLVYLAVLEALANSQWHTIAGMLPFMYNLIGWLRHNTTPGVQRAEAYVF